MMMRQTGWWTVALALCLSWQGIAQTLTNQALNGKYYFRHISLGLDGATPAGLSDPRSMIGTITFDGAGRFSLAGQQVVGAGAAAPATANGAYSVDPGGFVSLDNPIRTGAKLNARYSSEALLGSSTEAAGQIFDLFVAIPAPASGATFGGPYQAAALEFPGGSFSAIRSTRFALVSSGAGALQTISVTGHAANLGGNPITQQTTGAGYTVAGDGSGTLTFGTASNAQLLSGSRTFYISANGNLILGGSTAAGSHDLLLGVKAMTGVSAATWNATFWAAGLRLDASGVSSYAGSLAARGAGKVTWSKRMKVSGFGPLDFTGVNAYSLTPDGTGSVETYNAALGASGRAYTGISASADDPSAYEIFFGMRVPDLSGTGIFVNPLGVVSAASFAPPGNPISPGQFVALFGTGLSSTTATARTPYPKTLNGISVQVNGTDCAIYSISPGQINFLVPYAVTGATATITVTNNGVKSNAVTVPVAPTAPGVYALDSSGTGPGAILHADYSVVDAGNPAAAGETVLIYLTGMGTLTPSVADGTAGASGTLYRATATDSGVWVAGRPGAVLFNGLAPGFPGLYQINVTLPAPLPFAGKLPLAIQTGNAYHDQVDIWIK